MADKELYVCAKCGERFLRKDFYKANGGVYAEEGYVPVCKECFRKIYRDFLATYLSEEKAVKRICMLFDLYYNEDLFKACDGVAPDAVIGTYMRQLSINQYRNRSLDWSIKEGFSMLSDVEVVDLREKLLYEKGNRRKDEDDDEPEKERKASVRDINKWGPGLEVGDYDELNNHEKKLREANPNMDSNQEIFIADLCYTKWMQMRAIREGRLDDYKTMTELYRKTFTQAGLKTVRESTSANEALIGVNIEMIEKYTPAEYYKDKSLFEDHDGVGDYFTRLVLRPLKNIFLGTNERDTEFCIKDEDDGDLDDI